ncbi:protein CHUP1, chloroplastic-like [Hordeum vulgare subsp. vulgare]|uniref:protein CHUP1, chloroplastic-like n=1 Tax=Hordeum vulgare subsp. vulgare TaxID=112509 RepID=UPI001D1A406D|nr:protein CHUP1, chloroplastic-like [Hordeum vulgare subsp. vulgare]
MPAPRRTTSEVPVGTGRKADRAPPLPTYSEKLLHRHEKREKPIKYRKLGRINGRRPSLHHRCRLRVQRPLPVRLLLPLPVNIRFLIKEVEGAAFVNIDGVVSFVKWLDDELSRLVDERAVLKHFEWPEQKADALREAAFGYRDLKKLKGEASSFRDDPRQPCAAALKKMQALFEKLEHGVYDLARVRDGATCRYGRFQIPSEWMRDAGIVGQIAEQPRGGVFLYNGKLLRIGYLCVYATMGLMG